MYGARTRRRASCSLPWVAEGIQSWPQSLVPLLAEDKFQSMGLPMDSKFQQPRGVLISWRLKESKVGLRDSKAVFVSTPSLWGCFWYKPCNGSGQNKAEYYNLMPNLNKKCTIELVHPWTMHLKSSWVNINSICEKRFKKKTTLQNNG